MSDNKYDIIIIGAGPAGLTAGLYASRAGMKTLLLEKLSPGGQLALTDRIDNYPGVIEDISGFELVKKMEDQAKSFGTEIKLSTVKSIEKTESGFLLNTGNDSYGGMAVIIASGAAPAKLDIPGEEKFTGKGVSYCAVCDAPFYKEKKVAIVGGGDTAVEEAIYLTKFASEVTIIHRRDRFRAIKEYRDKAENNPKIKFRMESVPLEITGDQFVNGINVKNVKTEEEDIIQLDGVFIFVGYIPNSSFLTGFLELNDRGYLLTDNEMKTNIPGIFGCGDIRQKKLRQVVTAAGDGATAAFSAINYVEELKGIAYK